MARRLSGEARKKALKRIIDRDGECCWICGRQVDLTINAHKGPNPLTGATIDHILEIVNGGGNEIENLKLAHFYCNDTRTNKRDPWVDFSKLKGWLKIE